jgi:hypothetical protein
MCNEERKPQKPKPHKHAAVIKAWADGAKVQVKERSGKWVDVDVPGWTTSLEYRVKPTTKCSGGYRRYVLKDCDGGACVAVLRLGKWSVSDVEGIETSREFVKWIDTEWQYYEWEE